MGLDEFLLAAFECGGIFNQLFHRAKLRDELLRRLRPDAGHAGNVIRRVTHQAKQVDDLMRLGHTPDFRQLGQADHRMLVALAAGLPHEGVR